MRSVQKSILLVTLAVSLSFFGCGTPPVHTHTPSDTSGKGISVTPAGRTTPAPVRAASPFQAGMNVMIYGHPWLGYSDMLFARLQRLGVNSVALVFPLFQAGWNSNDVYTSPSQTPTNAELDTVIKSAHRYNLAVMLRPVLDETSLKSSGHWRGTIQPTDRQAWFKSYKNQLGNYASLAETDHVESVDIGSEFRSLESDSTDWLATIQYLRGLYKGQISYSFDWSNADHIPSIGFVTALDVVGIDAYYPLNAPIGATVTQLKDAWQPWLNQVKAVMKVKPVVFTEAGCLPVSGAYQKPASWNFPNSKLDWQAQARYYQATYEVWHAQPIQGIYWWGVELWQSTPGPTSFNPLGTPTESVIGRLFRSR